jgi:DNA-binding NarL/FixJ family response regulator
VPESARAAAVLLEVESLSQARNDKAHEKAHDEADLTARELEILRLIAASKSNQEIAAALVLSIRTVERHISNIYQKLHISGPVARATATAYILRHDLSQPPLA